MNGLMDELMNESTLFINFFVALYVLASTSQLMLFMIFSFLFPHISYSFVPSCTQL